MESNAETFPIGTPSPVIDPEETAPSHDSVIAGSPSRRFGDLSVIVADQPLAQVVSEAASHAAGHIAYAIPSNPFTNVDERLNSLDSNTRADNDVEDR